MLLRLDNGVERVGNLADANLRALPGVAAGVEVVIIPRQILHPQQIIRHSHPGKFPGVLILGAGIDGVGGVGHQRAEVMLPQQLHKRLSVRRVNGLGPAAPGIAREKLKGVCADGQRGLSHGKKTAGGGEMAADR